MQFIAFVYVDSITGACTLYSTIIYMSYLFLQQQHIKQHINNANSPTPLEMITIRSVLLKCSAFFRAFLAFLIITLFDSVAFCGIIMRAFAGASCSGEQSTRSTHVVPISSSDSTRNRSDRRFIVDGGIFREPSSLYRYIYICIRLLKIIYTYVIAGIYVEYMKLLHCRYEIVTEMPIASIKCFEVVRRQPRISAGLAERCRRTACYERRWIR